MVGGHGCLRRSVRVLRLHSPRFQWFTASTLPSRPSPGLHHMRTHCDGSTVSVPHRSAVSIDVERYVYDLPDSLIAQHPSEHRGDSRLLVPLPDVSRSCPPLQQHVFSEAQLIGGVSASPDSSCGGSGQPSLRFSDLGVNDLSRLVPPNAHMVFNQSRVLHARMFALPRGGGGEGTRSDSDGGGAVEVMFLGPHPPGANVAEMLQRPDVAAVEWHCMIGSQGVVVGDELVVVSPTSEPSFSPLHLEVVALLAGWSEEDGSDGVEAVVRFTGPAVVAESTSSASQIFDRYGTVPLPPYMSRPLEAADTQRYQTVYANAAAAGSVAAPTAGLHFTPELLDKLSAAGIKQSFVTLHVSAGTFQPITATNIADHVMHWEEFLVKTSAIRDVVRSLQLGRPIIPVGTTTTRVLESLYWLGARGLLEANPQSGQHTEASTLQQWEAYELADRFSDVLPSPAQALLFMAERGDRGGDGVVGGSTAICIAPGYTFRLCDALVTNFHQPHSTLMLQVGALMGESATRQMYAHAVQERYQFLSYGDACLITNRQQKDSNGVQADPPAPPTIGADMDAAKQSVLGDSDTALPPGTKVLLHSCCAPCSGAMIEQMRSEGHAVTILFYNPNIHPKEEYELRKDENKRYAKALDIPFVDLDYDTDEWFRQAQGMEFSPERGDRCTMCFDMRFARTAQYAQEHDFAVITTTNATSRWKDAEQVNASGARAVAQYDGVSWWFRDWQTEEMTQRKYKINAEERFYKQEYCGCIFSLRDTNAYRRKEGQDPVTIAGAQQYSDPAADSEEESLEAVRQFFNHTESAEEQQARELKEMYRERRKSARAVKENNW